MRAWRHRGAHGSGLLQRIAGALQTERFPGFALSRAFQLKRAQSRLTSAGKAFPAASALGHRNLRARLPNAGFAARVAEPRRISRAGRQYVGTRAKSSGRARDRRPLHAQTDRIAMRTRDPGGASEYAHYRHLRPVSLRPARCGPGRPRPGGATSHRQAAGANRSAGRGAGYDRATGIVRTPCLQPPAMLPSIPARSDSSACDWG